jgi:hypothetical protein
MLNIQKGEKTMSTQTDLKLRVEQARQSIMFSSYQGIRDLIMLMVKDMMQQGAAPSDYWSQEVAGFEYLFDASPLILERFREHCYHITGIHGYPYRAHHGSKNVSHSQRYDELKAIDSRGLFVPESPIMNGFGYDVGVGLANIDTLKFYEVLIGLDKAGLLSSLSAGDTVIEIGAGWGGFAYQMRMIFPAVRYVIIDLPHTMLFSAVYLRNAFPDARLAIHGEPDFEARLASGDFDFAFVPHFAANQYDYPVARFGVNIASFQEMTAEQVSGYAALLSKNRCAAIYSLNREHSPYNTQLASVESELSKYYQCSPVHVLDTAYTSIGKKIKGKEKIKEMAKKLKIKVGPEDLGYKHLVGRL